MNLPLLSQPEAALIGKRITNIIGASGPVGSKLKALRKMKSQEAEIAQLRKQLSRLDDQSMPPPPLPPSTPTVRGGALPPTRARPTACPLSPPPLTCAPPFPRSTSLPAQNALISLSTAGM